MAVAAWAASTAFSVGDIRRATTEQPSGLFFRCSTAGTSASSEPGWPNMVGDTVTDGTCVWTAIASAYEELAKINPSAIIELFELRLDSTLHGAVTFTAFMLGPMLTSDGNIVFNSQTYTRIPIKADGFEYRTPARCHVPRCRSAITTAYDHALLLLVNATTAGNDLGGAEVRRIKDAEESILDGESAADPNAQLATRALVYGSQGKRDTRQVTFELASKFDLAGQKIPKRQVIANVCQWKYRSSECSYTGTNYLRRERQ